LFSTLVLTEDTDSARTFTRGIRTTAFAEDVVSELTCLQADIKPLQSGGAAIFISPGGSS